MLNALLVALAVTIPQPTANRIVDQAGLLNTDETIELNNLFQDVQRTDNVNLGLLTLTNLDDDPKVIAVRTLNFWQMSPDSVLLLVSMNPRKVFLQPGNNLSTKFTESVSQDLVRRTMVPSLRAGRTGEAVLGGFRAVRAVVAARPQPVTPAPATSPDRQFTQPNESTSGNVMLVFTVVMLGGLAFIGLIMAIAHFSEKRRARRGLRRGEVSSGTTYRPVLQPIATAKPTRTVTSAPAPTTTVVHTGGSSDFVNGMVVNELLHRHDPAPVAPPASRYSPPKYSPPPSPPRRSSYSDSSSSYGSSSSDSSSGWGGGGSSWSSDSGGSSSDGGGGGGSDW